MLSKTRTCRRCSRAVPPADFVYTHGNLCRPCYLQKQREYHLRVKDRVNARRRSQPKSVKKDIHLKRDFGISLQEYGTLLIAQEGRCKICGRTPVENVGRRALAVDHNHTTGKIRGLLCTACNVGLGNFGDSTEMLTKAIVYLTDAVD